MANITKIYEIKLQGQGPLLEDMKKVNKEFEAASSRWKELKKLIASGGLSTADTAKFKAEMAAAKLETERLRQEQIRLKNETIALGNAQKQGSSDANKHKEALEQEKIATEKLRQETIKLKNENLALSNAQKQQAADQRKAREETNQSSDAWKRLLNQLNSARNAAKNTAVKFGIDSSEFKVAAAAANELDSKVKQIESRLGQFQRNVGNYPGNQMLKGLNENTLQALVKSGFGSIIANQVNLARERTKELDAQFTLLKNKLSAVRTNATGDLDAIQREILENRAAAAQLNNEIGRIQTQFRNATSMGARMAENLKGYFRNLKSEITTFLVGYLSFQAAFAKTQEMVQNAYDISDGVTALEIELQKAAGGAEKLVDQLAKLDTRTKLPELLNIGNIAVKAGVDESNLVGVVSAIDKIKVAFGKDFGDVETGTESLVKLINVFENGQVTEERMLRTGNAVRTIANESVASVPYLNDFAKRMAGVKGISEITLPSVLGLASGFEQFGQSAETTSTALVRIIPKIAADTEKFAKISGMTQKAFSQMLNENPDQALIKVAEGLTKNKQGLEDLIASFQDSDLAAKGGAGITTTIAVLGKNSEVFKKTIESAKNAYQDTSNITDAFAKRNENLAASMDKLKKGFVDAARNEKFQAFLKGSIALIVMITSAITGIPLTAWYVLLGLVTLAYYENIKAVTISLARQTAQVALTIIHNALITATNVLIRLQAAAVYLANAAWTVLNATMLYLGTIVPAIRSAWISLNIAILATPTGWLIAGFAAVAGALALLVAATEDSAESLRKQGQAIKQSAAEMRVNAEITRKATESTVDQISKIEILTRVLRDNNVGLETKKRALQELININPQVLNALTLENIKTKEGLDLLRAYKKELLEVAKAKAAQSLLESKSQEIINNELKISELNNDLSKRYGKDIGGLRQAKNAITDVIRGYASDIGLGDGDIGKQIIELTNLNKKLKEDQDVLLKKVTNNTAKGIVAGITDNDQAANSKETLESLKAEIDALNEVLVKTETKTKQWYAIKAEIAKKQAYYDSLTKTEKTKDKASNLSGTQKDFIKDLDASNKDRLSAIEDNFAKGKIAEDDFIKKSLASNVKYYDAKIAYLKKGNAEERKQVAQAGFDKAKAEREANDKLFSLSKKRVDDQLKNDESEIQKKKEKIVNDPYSTEQQRLDAEKTFFEESTSAQIVYNQKMLDLQAEYSKKSVEDTNAMFRALDEKLAQENRNTREYRIKATRVSFSVSDNLADEITNANEISAAGSRKLILQNKELSNAQKKIELEKIAARLELQNINTELGNVVAKIRLLEDEINKRELTNDEMREFNRLLRERSKLEENKAKSEQNVIDTGSALPSNGLPGSGVSGLASSLTKSIVGKDNKLMIGDKDYSEQAGFVIAQAFDMAQQSMNSYFDAERNRIEQSKQLAYERIDLETKQALRFAQSSAERERIEKEANDKKKKADKEAGEKLKKTKKAEAKIAFLMQLANIWSTAMQLGPIAGPIMGGVLSLLAGIQYASTIKGIDSTQYKRGGKFAGGGKLSGPSHSNGGMPVYDPISGSKVAEMEGGEAIINQNTMSDTSVYNVSGTPSQIASKLNSIGGGVDWDGGATMKKFLNGGRYLGSNLQAPFIKSYYDTSNAAVSSVENTERFDRIESKIEDLADLQIQESFKRVYVSGKDIAEDQRERAKRTEIATL